MAIIPDLFPLSNSFNHNEKNEKTDLAAAYFTGVASDKLPKG
jgi:hypothetical protein